MGCLGVERLGCPQIGGGVDLRLGWGYFVMGNVAVGGEC